MIIDGMMHLEANGTYWEGLIDAAIRHYDAAGIDKGVVMATWLPSRESNDITFEACRKYPDRFIPFGHVRPIDDWQTELKRVAQEFGWTGLKLHQGELQYGGANIRTTTWAIVARAAEFGIQLVKIHLVDYPLIDELTASFPQITWILPHLGCYDHWEDMHRYCDLARTRANVYLDTSAVAPYYEFGRAFEWAGGDKITFATDGFVYSPLVELAKIRTLQLPTPYRTRPLTDQEVGMILGGTMARLLGL